MSGPQIAAVTQAGRNNGGLVGYRVWCDEHGLDREVRSEAHATNLLTLHQRKDHPTTAKVGEPTTIHLSRAADYLLIARAQDIDTNDRALSAYMAALDMWTALTGLTDVEALAYAESIRTSRATAAPVPF